MSEVFGVPRKGHGILPKSSFPKKNNPSRAIAQASATR
jgi:hypothetical protein